VNGQNYSDSFNQFVNSCTKNNTNFTNATNINWILASNSDNDPDQNYLLLQNISKTLPINNTVQGIIMISD